MNRSDPSRRPVDVDGIATVGDAALDSLDSLTPVALLPLSAIAVLLFVASAVFLHGGALNLDAFVAVQRAAAGLPDTAWSMITICGTGVVAFALLAPTLRSRPRWYAAGIAAAALAGFYANGAKRFFALPRPASVLEPGQLHVIGATLHANTFPSGHSVTAFTLAAILVFASRRPLLVATGAVPMATLIALSRIAVGAHWPADLAAGAAGGWVSGALGVMIVARWRVWNTAAGVRTMGCVSIGIGLSLCIVDLGYPLALPLQYAAAAIAIASGLVVIARPRLDALLPCRRDVAAVDVR